MATAEHFCDERLLPGKCYVCIDGPRPKVLIDSWAGRQAIPVELLKRTPKRYRVRLLSTAPGIAEGEIRYVPHAAVVLPARQGGSR